MLEDRVADNRVDSLQSIACRAMSLLPVKHNCHPERLPREADGSWLNAVTLCFEARFFAKNGSE